MLSLEEQGDLEQYFGPAGGGGRSTFGPMLERAEQHYRMSDGRVVDTRRIVPVTRELADSTASAPRFARVLSPWPYIRPRAPAAPAGVEPEDRDDSLQLAARLSRRMGQLNQETRALLGLLYGDEGCRWDREPKWGRVWVLVPFTRSGQRQLERDQESRQAKGQPVLLQPAERLRILAERPPRPAWTDAALDQAELLRRQAELLWEGTA